MFLKPPSLVSEILLIMAALVGPSLAQQALSRLDRERAQDMLHVVADEVRKHYYDPQLHGLNWDANFEVIKQKVDKSPNMNIALTNIAAVVEGLNDSHTFFLPPAHVNQVDYGFQYQMVGDRCFITRVRPKSDAEAKGAKPGDEILSLNGYTPNRDVLWKMQYVFSVLLPQLKLRLSLQDPSGHQRAVEVASKVREGRQILDFTGGGAGNDIFDLLRQSEDQSHLMRARSASFGSQLMVLKVPEFFFSETAVEGMIEQARAFPGLIIDLRGNPGGSVETLKYLLGGVFDKEVKIADRVGRKESKPEVSKKIHNPYTGKLAVLVDSKSASAAELFARVIQLEHRGAVLGDRSSGSVMEARRYSERQGTDRVVFYGVSVTEWDLIMTDGNSLEHIGVTPDEVVLPNAEDLAAGRDPVLAHAAETLGVKASPEEAGKTFPYEWPAE